MENKLKAFIEERGMKQGFLAKKVGVSPGTMSLIVRGKSIPTLLVAIQIARTLDTTVEELWGHMTD